MRRSEVACAWTYIAGMGRIQKAYETQFFWLLKHVGARRPHQGVQWLVEKARQVSASKGISPSEGLIRVYEELAAKPAFRDAKPLADSALAPIHFFCDAGLGGLARWLRAAGYEARWEAGIDDDVLLREARQMSATVLTTDSMLMERRLLRDRVIPAFWLPPTLSISDQLMLVFREFNLKVRPSRCMSCGGEMRQADKEALREQIPPRTYRWLNEFFVCVRCGKLFWHGTHWFRIIEKLKTLKQ
ncbi:MAG TPA: Mut7-C RNAse domain-containing protein [Clostridia bacterium]|nr:Mut7-C RNAse domain-containing protein [Clostridia bacterium]